VKTPNDPTTIASARERFAGVDEPTATDQTLAAWILAKDYERIRQERDELRAALQGLLAVIVDTDQRPQPSSMRMVAIVSGRPEFDAIDAARAAIAKAKGDTL
jgi:phosphopantetheinyl transferase